MYRQSSNDQDTTPKYLIRCKSPYYVQSACQGAPDIPLNCGKCPYCKKRRVNSWVFRLLQEERRSSSSYFITLTYDNDYYPNATPHLPITESGRRTLKKRDFQLFMKRLRKLQKTKIKYYAVGEYGTKTYRPHYHAIIFNVEDIEYINQAWQLGSVHIGDVSGASIAYTAKYIDKQKRIPIHKNDDRAKEFSLISKGIGSNYITKKTKKYHKQDITRMYVTHPDGIRVAMPKYYRDRIFNDAEKTKQRDIISKLEEEEIKKYGQEFAKNYKNADITFDQYMSRLKSAEHDKFYNNKNRSKI